MIKMEKEDILKIVDHTLLLQTATWEEIKAVCDDGIRYKTASVCIPPCYVKRAKEYIEKHYFEKFSLDEMAKDLYIDKISFQSPLKSSMRFNPSQVM